MASSSKEGGKTEVRRLRERADLTQEEAAGETGIPLRTFQGYDRGETEPPTDRMDHIRRVLGGAEKKVASVSQNDHIESSHIKKYPVAGTGDTPTVTIDDRVIDVRGGMPQNAKAHRVNDRWMGPWLDVDLVLVEPKAFIDGPGRYCVRWADGEDKVVLEAWRHSNDEVAIRTHAPENTSILTEVERNADNVLFARPDGSELHVEVIGLVVYPSDSVRLMTKGMADTAARIIKGGG